MLSTLESFERTFNSLLDVLGPAVHSSRSGTIIGATQIEPELRGDNNFATKGR